MKMDVVQFGILFNYDSEMIESKVFENSDAEVYIILQCQFV